MRPVFEVDDEHIDVFCAACGVPLEKVSSRVYWEKLGSKTGCQPNQLTPNVLESTHLGHC